jgi:3-hydroxy-D-aspartate aldolase
VNIAEVSTPALLLDLRAFERNVRRMADFAAAAGKQLRPHAKAHKCVEIARRQIAAGAAGVCVATVPEAELMVRAGIPGVLLTSPIADPQKCRRMVDLAGMAPDVMVVIDHPRQLQMYAEHGVPLRMLVDIDVGDHRTGITPGEPALRLADAIASHRHMSFAGLQAYSVRASHIEDPDERARYSADALDAVLQTRDLLTGRGLPVPMVTGGSTGSYECDATLPCITELQAGSYALMDLAYARIGIDFANALAVMGTVISANYPGRVTVDAGFKAFSTDRPFGPETPEGRYEWAGDEFGYVYTDKLGLGDRIHFIPPHCDPTVNLYDRIYVRRGDEVIDVWPVMDRHRCSGMI